MTGAQATWLPGGRLHLNHGPMDVIVQGWGDSRALTDGYARAAARFDTILAELASELPELRAEDPVVTGTIARRMAEAVAPFRPAFITPMAAVAGAVAETVLAAFVRPGIARAYANNGGDIALHLEPGQTMTCAIATPPGAVDHHITIRAEDDVRGIATSGWRGRSWSFGIADSVTVLAKTAALADAAATMVANSVDLPDHPAISRRAANEVQCDSDLGAGRITTGVGPLTRAEVATALNRGVATAEAFRARGLVTAAALFLYPESRRLGPLTLSHAAKEPRVA
jgi:uncharacterized protein